MLRLLARNNRSTTLQWRALLFLALVAWPGYFACAEQPGYQLGVFPHLAAGQLEKVFALVASDFSKATGRPVALKTKPTFEAFTYELDKQTYDIAFVQPFDYVRARDKHGYIPLARRGEPLNGLFVVKPDSPLRTLEDTRGKIIGLPPEVAAVSHLAKMALLQAKINLGKDVRLQHYKVHDTCLQQLLIGEIDVCATAAFPLRFFENEHKIKLKVLAETKTISHSLFIVHPRISEKHRDAILKAILSWPKTESGRQILEKGQLKPFIAVTDAEYDTVREYSRKMQNK